MLKLSAAASDVFCRCLTREPVADRLRVGVEYFAFANLKNMPRKPDRLCSVSHLENARK